MGRLLPFCCAAAEVRFRAAFRDCETSPKSRLFPESQACTIGPRAGTRLTASTRPISWMLSAMCAQLEHKPGEHAALSASETALQTGLVHARREAGDASFWYERDIAIPSGRGLAAIVGVGHDRYRVDLVNIVAEQLAEVGDQVAFLVHPTIGVRGA
jgi:hypothetical protein